jgi:hypothetical protein
MLIGHPGCELAVLDAFHGLKASQHGVLEGNSIFFQKDPEFLKSALPQSRFGFIKPRKS